MKFTDCMSNITLSVSESSGGHDPLFRKGVRRGVKARFQNVFDVGGFYVECESERAVDELLINENITPINNGCGIEEVEVEEGLEGEGNVQQSRLRTAAHTSRRSAAAQALSNIESMQKD